MLTTCLSGPEGSAAAGDQQPVTAALDQLAVAVVGQLGPAAAGMPAGRAGRAVGAVVPHQPATPSTTAGDESGKVCSVSSAQRTRASASSRRAAGRPWMVNQARAVSERTD